MDKDLASLLGLDAEQHVESVGVVERAVEVYQQTVGSISGPPPFSVNRAVESYSLEYAKPIKVAHPYGHLPAGY